MANLIFNIALARMTEWYIRVDTNDPTNSALVIIAWVTTETDTNIRRLDDVSLVEANVNTAEATNTNYARIELTDADLIAFAPDDTNDRVDLDIPDQTWTNILAGDNWTDVSINYDSDTIGGVDADIVPGTWHDFSVNPDGSDITAQVSVDGFFRASE